MLLQVVCTGPTHLCVAHLNCTKKVHSIFFDEVRLGGGGGCWRGGSMFQEVGGCMGFQRGWGDLSSGLSQPGGKSC